MWKKIYIYLTYLNVIGKKFSLVRSINSKNDILLAILFLINRLVVWPGVAREKIKIKILKKIEKF